MFILKLLSVFSFISATVSIGATSTSTIMQQATDCYYAGDNEQALALFYQAAELNPLMPEIHFNIGFLLSQKNYHEKAIHSYLTAIKLKDDYYKAHRWIAYSYAATKNRHDAIAHYERATTFDEVSHDIFIELARLYQATGTLELANHAFENALVLQPDDTNILFEYAVFLISLDQLEKSLNLFEQIVTKEPNNVKALYNCAYVLKLSGKFLRACYYYKKTLQLEPYHKSALFGFAQAALGAGDFATGWRHFEYRWADPEQVIRECNHQDLKPEQLKGKTVLLLAEWGLGDMMQFIRYAHKLKEQGAIVYAQTFEPLVPFFSLCSYIDKVIPVGQPLPATDHLIPLLSLPFIFNTTPATIPTNTPYLYAQQELIESWKNQLSNDKSFKIGIVWQAKPTIFLEHHPRSRRSVPLALFKELADIPGVTLYSLQQVDGLDQLNNLPAGMIVKDFGQDFDKSHGRYMDTAAVVHALDLVISVDTSVIHVVAAQGLPVWVMMPYAAEWRWALGESTTPWYPSMRLFKQPAPGDWDTVMHTISHEVKNIINVGK